MGSVKFRNSAKLWTVLHTWLRLDVLKVGPIDRPQMTVRGFNELSSHVVVLRKGKVNMCRVVGTWSGRYGHLGLVHLEYGAPNTLTAVYLKQYWV